LGSNQPRKGSIEECGKGNRRKNPHADLGIDRPDATGQQIAEGDKTGDGQRGINISGEHLPPPYADLIHFTDKLSKRPHSPNMRESRAKRNPTKNPRA
jgi:hypothetical protein